MYSEKGLSGEKFSDPATFEDATQHANGMAADGYEVIAIVTVEHAAERKKIIAQDGSPIPGAHLIALLNDIVRRFRRDYSVSRESALEAVSLLCTLSLEGATDLQTALLDEIHTSGPPGTEKWRQDMRIAIANRQARGAS